MSCKAGYDESMLRAYLDRQLPSRQSNELGRHLRECEPCASAMAEMEGTHAFVTASLGRLDPSPDSVPDAPAAYARATAVTSELPARAGILARLGSLFSPLRPLPALSAACVLLVAAMLFTPLGAAAQDFISVFRAQQIQTIKVSQDSLRQLPGPGDLGQFDTAAEPEFAIVTSAEAARSAGFAVRAPARLPADFATKSVVALIKPVSATYTYNGEKLAAYWQDRQLPGKPPAELSGLVVKADLPTTVVQVFGDSATIEQAASAASNPNQAQAHPTATSRVKPRMIVIAQSRGPQVSVPAGVDVAKLRKDLLDRGALPEDLALQLAAISDWQSTLPVPVVQDVTREVTVAGVKGVLFAPPTKSDDPMVGVIWQKGGVWYWVFGAVTEQELLAAANSLG